MAEAIDGIVLNDLVSGVEGERLENKRQEIKRTIHGIYNDIYAWNKDIDKKMNEVKALTAKVQAAQEKLAKLKAGDWSALPKPPNPNAPTPEA